MPLDPIIQALFQEWPQLAIRPVWEKTPVEARALFKQFCQFADPKIVAIGKSEDIKMPGPAGPIGPFDPSVEPIVPRGPSFTYFCVGQPHDFSGRAPRSP